MGLLLCPGLAHASPSFTQQAVLTASPTNVDGRFGAAVSLDGDTAVVGAPSEAVATELDHSATYVFTRSGSSWTQQATLTRPGGGDPGESGFGASVAIDGDTLLIGGTQAGPAVQPIRHVFVFVRSGGSWTPQATLTASDASDHDFFGNAVSIAGDTAVIGALSADSPAETETGAVYVFTRSGTVWTERAKLIASDGAFEDGFGGSVALSGNTVLVGSVGAGTDDQGAAYAFVGSGSSWTEQAKFVGSDIGPSGHFGASVALDGDTTAVGSDSGAVYVFVRASGSWSEQAKLVGSDSSFFFSQVVAMQGNFVASADPAPVQGTTFVFERTGVSWAQHSKLVTPDPNSIFALAIDGTTLLAGSTSRNAGEGGVIVYTRGKAPADIALSPSSVPENKPVGTVVGTFSTTDADSGDSFTYALVPGAGSDNNDVFTISGDKLKTGKTFNYENKSSYTVRVRSTDSVGLSFEKAFTINITDVKEINHAPVCTNAAATPNLLIADSELSFASIAIGNVTDQENDHITIKVTSIRQDESTRASWSDPSPDGKGVGSSIPLVRRQAASTGNGRVYSIAFTATDVNRATSCVCTLKVGVKPKSSSATPKDGGAYYDSTR